MGDGKEKIIYVFIDASNLWAAIKAKGRFIDFEKTISYIKDGLSGTKIKTFYFTSYPANGTRDYSLDSKHKFFTYLEKALNFAVIKKELKRISISTENGYRIEEKGNMDVEMAINAIHYMDKYNAAVFLTGDSDFLALITYLKNHGKRVFIYSSKNNVSEELRTGGDGYIDLLTIDEIWGKELKHRAELEKENK